MSKARRKKGKVVKNWDTPYIRKIKIKKRRNYNPWKSPYNTKYRYISKYAEEHGFVMIAKVENPTLNDINTLSRLHEANKAQARAEREQARRDAETRQARTDIEDIANDLIRRARTFYNNEDEETRGYNGDFPEPEAEEENYYQAACSALDDLLSEIGTEATTDFEADKFSEGESKTALAKSMFVDDEDWGKFILENLRRAAAQFRTYVFDSNQSYTDEHGKHTDCWQIYYHIIFPSTINGQFTLNVPTR